MKKRIVLAIMLIAGTRVSTHNVVHKTIDGHTYNGYMVSNKFVAGSFYENNECQSCSVDNNNLMTCSNCYVGQHKNMVPSTSIYPATPITDPDGNTFVPLIGVHNGKLELENMPQNASMVPLKNNSSVNYLIYGSFGESTKDCTVVTMNPGGIFNTALYCSKKGDGGNVNPIFPAITAESPYGGMHTPSITNIAGSLIDTNNGSYLSILNKFFGGNWNHHEDCYTSIFGNNYFVTACSTGKCKHESKGKRFRQQIANIFDHHKKKCSFFNKVKAVPAEIREKLKTFFIGNYGGRLRWKSRSDNKWGDFLY